MSDFRYGRLIEVKEKLLDYKKTELDSARTSLKAVVAEITDVDEDAVRTYACLTEKCITGNELSVLTGYLSYLDSRKNTLNLEKTQQEHRIAALQQELLNLEIERKMLEKLRFKTLQITKKASNKKEQKIMDELALRVEGQ